MRIKIMAGIAALAIAASSVVATTPAQARWHGGGWYGGYHGGGYGWGPALGGFAAGAIIGGALAAPAVLLRPGYGYRRVTPMRRAARSATACSASAPTTRRPAPISAMTAIVTLARKNRRLGAL